VTQISTEFALSLMMFFFFGFYIKKNIYFLSIQKDFVLSKSHGALVA